MTSRIPLRVEFEGRGGYLTPLSIEIDLEEHLKTADMERFEGSQIRMVDEATGRTIPCQFSPSRAGELKGTISWIHPSHAHQELEIIVGDGLSRRGWAPRGVEILDRGDYQLEVYVEGEHVTNYVFNTAYERPFLYPVIGPDGLNVVRHIPNFGDHPHHKGISISLGDVSGRRGEPGIDFWGLGRLGDPRQGRVIHQRFASIEQGPVYGMIQVENLWKQNDELESPTGAGDPPVHGSGRLKIKKRGEVLMREARTVTVWNVSSSRLIDIHTVLRPAVEEIVLSADVEGRGAAKENGPLVIRVADNMRGTAEGTIVNSEGGRTERECWGRRARWVDYHGPVVQGGPVNGIAAMDHPSNLRHPTAWHVRDYGLFAANPFYDKKPEWPDQGPVYLSRARGDRLEMRYRIYIHQGDEKRGRVEEKWQEWANPPRVTIR
jgi:hypothetical protein